MTISGTNLASEYSYLNTLTDGLYKTNYGELYDEVFNVATPFWNEVPKSNNWTGKRMEFPVPTAYMGGVGSGSLPEWRPSQYGDVGFTSKKMYAVNRVDRESVMASLGNEGAFVKLMAEASKRTTQADVWNHNRAIFNDGTGKLGTIASSSGVTDNGSGNYTIVISTATWKEANWEEGILINVGTGTTDKFLVKTVAPSTLSITIQRQAGGTKVPANSDAVFMQGSENNDIMGLKVLDLTSTSAYGVTVSRKWQAGQIFNYGAGISPQLLNRIMLTVEKQCGRQPTMGVTSYKQYELLLNQMEDQKRYQMTQVSAKGVKAQISYKGIEFIGSQGTMNIFPDKFCEDDRFYALNPKYCKYFRRPNTGFVKEDIGGQGYLRVVDEDQFELRHATYGEFFIALPFHGVVTGLTTS